RARLFPYTTLFRSDALEHFRNGESTYITDDVAFGHLAGHDTSQVARFIETRVGHAYVGGRLVAGRVDKGDIRELLGHLQRRVHVAEGSREDQLVALLGQVANNALCVSTLGHVFHVLAHYFVTQGLHHLAAAHFLLPAPAGFTDGAHIDKAHLQRFLRLCDRVRTGTQCERQRRGTQSVANKFSRHDVHP